MSKVNHDKYDVVILGAGMGGLVCGCYLAKAGMKVLIVEKNTRPGGYCMSFAVNGFYFDACVHSLGSLRKGGVLREILQELNLSKRISIKRYSPSDTVVTKDYKINFWNELDKTVKEFSRNFPKEQENIKRFFEYLDSNQKNYTILRKRTFQDILDHYFRDNQLKAILSILVLVNAGLPPSRIAAFTAVMFYKEFMLDGGYYPKGGIQALPDVLAERFKQLGGTLLLSDIVEKVHVQKGTAYGITTKKNGFVPCKYVVSDIDAKQLFLDFIDRNEINPIIVKRINKLTHSNSMFILYLGLNKKISTVKPLQNIWLLETYKLDKSYDKAMDQGIDRFQCFLVRVLADGKSILAMTLASYKTARYWQENKTRLKEIFIKKIIKVIPEIKNTIIFQSVATPHTLYGWTRNSRGASYGWAETPSQFALPGLSQTTFIRNLYQTGHWASIVQGISGVIYLGKDTARIIIRREKKNDA